MMFFRISVVPPAIDAPRERSTRNAQSESLRSAPAPKISVASSLVRCPASDHIHFGSEPSGPGAPFRICVVSPR
jgi:hypothetical protein